jgi:hypothetical protein
VVEPDTQQASLVFFPVKLRSILAALNFLVFACLPIAAQSLAEALDQPTLSFTATGNLPWTGQSTTTHDGVDAIKSGAITHSQTSEISTTVDGPGPVSFWWKVSSESGYDFLLFFIDGTKQAQISGSKDWARLSATLSTGKHTLKWVYSKDNIESSGSDCGWLDQLVVPSTLPKITKHPQDTAIRSGAVTTLDVIATGSSPLTYQWYCGTSGTTVDPINGATGSSYTTPELTKTTAYWVRVTSPTGTIDSNTATITACVKPTISVQPNGTAISEGDNARLQVTASGGGLTYEWWCGPTINDSTRVLGATGSTLITPALRTATSYWVSITNPAGLVLSAIATVSVNDPPYCQLRTTGGTHLANSEMARR